MKTKMYLIAIAIIGGMLFTASSTETISTDEQQSTKVDRKTREIFASKKVDRKTREIFADARVDRKTREIFA